MSKRLESVKKIFKQSAIRHKGIELPDNKEWASIHSYKGLNQIFHRDIHTRSSALSESIYFDWYHAVRMSKLFWFAHVNKASIKDGVLRKVFKDFGSAFTYGSFNLWAINFAASLFAETKNFDLVRKINPFDPPYELSTEDHLVLAIPLNIPREFLLPQIINFLGAYHPGRNLDLIKSAHTSRYKLHTLRFRLPVLEIERLVFVYKVLYPETPLWIIADRLQLAPNNKVRDTRFLSAKKVQINRLNSIAGRHLFKYKRRVINVERGSFPNPSALDDGESSTPFGIRKNAEYLTSTDESSMNYSEWQDWIHHEYHPWLVREVIKRNHLDKEKVNPTSMSDFLSGKRDSVVMKL